MKYKLNYFGLNKQSLKRKVKNVTVDITKLNNILEKRGTLYELSDIKYIIETIYGNSDVKTTEPLSLYYSKKNNKKYKDLIDLIEIADKDNLDEKIIQEITELHEDIYSNENNRDTLKKRVKEISLKYLITSDKVEIIFNGLENNWIEKLK